MGKQQKQQNTLSSSWNGVPTKERARRATEIAPPESKSQTRCTIVPPIKPHGYAVKTKKNHLEKALDDAEYHALALYVYGRIHAEATPSTTDLNSAGGGGYGSKLPFSAKKQLAINWCAFIDNKLAPEHLDILEELVQACVGEQKLDEHVIGKAVTGSNDNRQKIGGYKGYLKAVSQLILENDKKYNSLLDLHLAQNFNRQQRNLLKSWRKTR